MVADMLNSTQLKHFILAGHNMRVRWDNTFSGSSEALEENWGHVEYTYYHLTEPYLTDEVCALAETWVS